ncbi:MAG: DUF6686 family protein [Lewinella sp.]|uniref:DUF6686 family protein n=1 Tax=Lewinella sp. TaxID=2004506 RepID=UPI003D6C5675
MNHSSGHESDMINVIIHDEFGYIVRCSGCGVLQIAFGNFCVDQSFPEFQRLAETIALTLKKSQSNKESSLLKSIYLPTPYAGFNLLFTFHELKKLNDMLQTALLIIQAELLASDHKTDNYNDFN